MTAPPSHPVNSLHAYFLRPGRPRQPIVCAVDRIRDGKSFTTRRVVAIQHGEAIFTMAVSFHHRYSWGTSVASRFSTSKILSARSFD